MGLPHFVEREFREFLLCGVFEAGVVWFQCDALTVHVAQVALALAEELEAALSNGSVTESRLR